MSKKKQVQTNPKKQTAEAIEKPSRLPKILNIATLVGLLFLLFYAPFHRGLYFTEEMSTTYLYSAVLFLVFIINRIINKEFRLFRTPLDIVAGLLVIAYLFPIMFGYYASAAGAWDKFLRYINYFFIYVITRDIIREEKNLKLLLNTILISTLGVCFLGIDAGAGAIFTGKLNWLIEQFFSIFKGNSSLYDIISFKFFGGFDEGRIYSTLQYPNVLASYIGAILITAIGLLFSANSIRKRAWYGASTFVLFYTFVLTGSRGMVLVLPIALIVLFLAFWKKETTIGFIADASIPVIIGTLFAATYNGFVNAGQYHYVWLTIILGMVTTGLISGFMRPVRDVLSKVSIKIYSTVIGVAVLILMIVIGIGLSLEKPLVIKHEAGENKAEKDVIREISNIKSLTEYSLNFDIDADIENKNNSAYSVYIYGIDKFYNLLPYAQLSGGFEKARKVMKFNTGEGIQNIRIQFRNVNEKSSAKFSNIILKETKTGIERRIIAQYRFLPTELVYKIKDISLKTHNAWQRMIFVSDAFKIIASHLFGIGGGGWEAEYRAYQSYDYSTKEVHNYPVQLCVETGIIGLLILITMVCFTAHHFFRIRSEQKELGEQNTSRMILTSVVFSAIVSFYLHSVLDFDFSLSAIPIIVWSMTGIISGAYISRSNYSAIKVNPFVQISGISVISIFWLLLLIAGFNSILGRYVFSQAITYEKQYKTQKLTETQFAKFFSKTAPMYEKYIELQPLDEEKRIIFSRYVNNMLTIGKGLEEERANLEKKLMDNILSNLSHEPNSVDALSAASSLNIAMNKVDTALSLADKVTVNYRFISSAYATKASLYMMAYQHAYQKKDILKAKGILEKVVEIKKEYENASKLSMKPMKENKDLTEVINKAEQILAQINKIVNKEK